MPTDNQQGRSGQEKGGGWRIGIGMEGPCDEGKESHGQDRSQGDVSECQQECGKKRDQDPHGFGQQEEERAQSGGYALAAAKIQPEGKNVSHNGKESSGRQEDGSTGEEGLGQGHGADPFQRI